MTNHLTSGDDRASSNVLGSLGIDDAPTATNINNEETPVSKKPIVDGDTINNGGVKGTCASEEVGSTSPQALVADLSKDKLVYSESSTSISVEVTSSTTDTSNSSGDREITLELSPLSPSGDREVSSVDLSPLGSPIDIEVEVDNRNEIIIGDDAIRTNSPVYSPEDVKTKDQLLENSTTETGISGISETPSGGGITSARVSINNLQLEYDQTNANTTTTNTNTNTTTTNTITRPLLYEYDVLTAEPLQVC